MVATKLLAIEREAAAIRKTKSGVEGRRRQQNSLGTKSDPSPNPSKRNPRAVDLISSSEGVPRDQLLLAEKLKKANPKIAEKVTEGKMTLEKGLSLTGLHSKKQKVNDKRQRQHKSRQLKNASKDGCPKDGASIAIEEKDGICTLRHGNVTIYSHPTTSTQAIVVERVDSWNILVTDSSRTMRVDTRHTAEKLAFSAIQKLTLRLHSSNRKSKKDLGQRDRTVS